MRFALSEEQEALRRQARQLMKQHAPATATRQAMESARGWDEGLWARMVELGWTALLVPEELGGLGLHWIELAALMEESGGALACAPLFSSVGLATNLLLLADGEATQRALLSELAAGRLRATVAFAAPPGRRGVRARRDGGDMRLDGELAFVVDGDSAELILVRADEGDGSVGLYAVGASARGLARHARPTLDATRRLADLRLDDVRLPASARLSGDGAALLERALERARVALAAESLGGAERCLALSVDYAKTRVQFNRPIGSFQAIKHRCADLLMLLECARSAVYWAAFCVATDDRERSVAAAIAHSYVGDAYLRAAGDTIQIHGGMGFTWEHDAHLHLRRARGSATLLGDGRGARERLARELRL